jgi:polyketide synthase PksN
MVNFVEYVVAELKSKRLSKSAAFELIKQFSARPVAAGGGDAVHPLLQVNVSDLDHLAFRSRLSGSEPFLADHRVVFPAGAAPVLPAVAYLEMARAAVQQAVPAAARGRMLELRHCVWAQPLVVRDPTTVSIELAPNADGGIDYDVLSGDGEQQTEHCQGHAQFVAPVAAPGLDIAGLQARMQRGSLATAEVYAAFDAMGLRYGPAHQAVQQVFRGEGQVLARLELPPSLRAQAASYVLHPSLLDGALQAAIGLMDGETRARLPFAVDVVRVFAACPSTSWVWLRHAPGGSGDDAVSKFDIDLCDANGEVCVQMHGFSARTLAPAAAADDSGVLRAVPYWQAAVPDAQPGVWAQREVIVCELGAVDAAVLQTALGDTTCHVLSAHAGDPAQRYGDHAVACLQIVQARLAAAPAAPLLLQLAVAATGEGAVFAGLAALLRSASRENPLLQAQLVLVADDTDATALAQQLQQARTHGGETRLRAGRTGGAIEVLRWREQEATDAPPVFKEHGVYLISGGLGGLGAIFARDILQQTRHARVILTGRSAATGARLDRLGALQADYAGRVQYRIADLADAVSVQALIDNVACEHGALHGILHCAGMTDDGFIATKTAAGLRAVLAPKVQGSLHLDQASRGLELDFFAAFSSVAGTLGNVGQADYAAANAFMDEFASYRNGLVAAGQRHGRSVAVAWPLWQAGGIVLAPELQAELERSTGMQPLTTPNGLRAFHQCLAFAHANCVVLEGRLPALRRTLAGTRPRPAAAAPVGAEAPGAQDLLDKTQEWLRRQFSQLLKLSAQRIDPRAPLDRYGIDSILAMRLTNTLEQTFGSLSKTLLFEYRSIADLAAHFVESQAAALDGLFSRHRTAAGSSAAVAVPTETPMPPRLRRSALRAAPAFAPAAAEPVAIVGLSGRYPESPDLTAYWANLRDGRDCIVEIPASRWDWRDYYSDDRREGGRHYSRWGGFITGVDEFDPLFFNMAPLEAERIDPQERLFLQHAWMAVEDAGYTRADLHGVAPRAGLADIGGQVGVYVGVMYSEYQLFGAEASLRGQRMGLAGSFASIANRVSYVLDVHGPSMTLDTMCSSSLTAIHLACQDLRLSRTRMAIAGGVNVTIHPNKYLVLSSGQFISGDGHCQSFGEGGDGYIPGEGVGAVVLKRLSDAQRDGDHIYGLIRGSALSHGGKTNGYTVPNPQAQTSAIALALREARVDARHVSYIEAHGTGTKLGDPIEIAALNKAFGQYGQDRQFCLIGSAKSNIGHCEAAAGIAGLTKVLLQLKHRQIVPSLHSRTLNPHIDFAASPFTVNQTLTDWVAPVVDGRTLPRIAGISSFGAGGSNAHMIVEEHVAAPTAAAAAIAEVAVLLSARTAEQLRRRAEDLLAFVTAAPDIDLVAMAHTLQTGREAMDERLGLVVADRAELLQKLQGWLAGDDALDEVHQGQVQRHRDTLALFSSDADLQQTVERWLTVGKLGKVVELWTRGLDVRWAALYGASRPARISLPTYPFARERYWIDTPAATSLATAATGGALHPLLHANVSDLSRQGYRSVFEGREPWLADHRVLLDGRELRVLPAVAYLEMARAAVEQAVPAAWRRGALELRHCAWAQPLIVEAPTAVRLVLDAAADGAVDFAIVSGDEETPVEHSRGQAAFVEEETKESMDIAALQQRLDGAGWSAVELYARLESLGLRYGPAHRSVRHVQRGSGEVLALLELPDCVRAQADAYVLHPSLLDGALQAALALFDGAASARLPFALDTLRVFGSSAATMWAWLRLAAGSRSDDAVARLDIDLCDAQGAVAVQLRGFSTRAMATAVPAADAGQGVLAAVPQWQALAAATPAQDWAQRQVVLCELPEVSAQALQSLLPGSRCSALVAASGHDLARRYEAHALAGLEIVRDLLAARSDGPVLLQWVIGDDRDNGVFAGIAGLLQSAALENPRFHGQVVTTGRGVAAGVLARQLQQAQAHPREAQLRFVADGAPQRLRWQEQVVPADDALAAFKPRGVYLITGGLGGLGTVFARAITAQAPEAQVVLTGRGELDDARLARLAALQPAGMARVHYRALDLDDAAQVDTLIAGVVDEFGALDGVLHSAGRLADGFLLHKSAADFRAVLAPKVAGTVNLDHATRQLDLQFFALFSSVAGAFGNVGQADYACANAFLDAFAQYRNQRVAAGERQGLTVSFNWPLWRDGGMQVPAVLQEQIARATGMGALSADHGLRAFAQALAQGQGRSLVMQGDLAAMRRTVFGNGDTAVAAMAAAPAPRAVTPAPGLPAGTTAAADLLDLTQEYLRRQFAASLKLPPQRIDVQMPLENYGIDSILAMRLTGVLEQTFGTLSKTLFFEYQSIAALTKYLVKAFPQIVARVTATAPVVAEARDAPHTAAVPMATPAFVPRRAFGVAPDSRGRAVAIVGLAGRYPQADDVDGFWDVLREGRDCITEIPAERWDHALYFDADRNAPGKSYSKWGGFMADIDKFDPLFFNIAPKEAELLDPQERLFLETAWQTIEDAGYGKQSLAGTRTGVYVGVMWGQYELYGVNSLAAGHLGVPSSSQASIANRVSYFFDLHGPSLAIDTMCSSSLTAIHLACEEIRRGTIDAAIAGGVNVSVHPHKYLTLSQGKFAASDGRCRSFGAGGDGYVPGEGVGAVLLKPLDHALRDGDHIYGIVRAGSINHGGKTNGYTVPNPNAQAELIADAFARAQIAPESLDYIEAHGTGTSLGDPIEITGLSRAFGDGNGGRHCAIGSVKSNIGHLESAAGIAAMTKVLLQIKHAQLVPSLHAEPVNPNIDFSQSPFRVQTTLAPWPRRDGQPRRSGISSFGAGGANAHVVVEEYIDTRTVARPAAADHLFVLSARSLRGLLRHARRMAAFLAGHAALAPGHVAYTLQAGRTGMNARLACVAGDLAGFVAALQDWIAAQDGGEDVRAAPDSGAVHNLVYGNSSDGDADAALLVDGAAGRAFLHELARSRDLTRLARLWALGAEIDWSLLHAGGTPRRVSLPTYPFERQRYWIDTTPLAAVRVVPAAPTAVAPTAAAPGPAAAVAEAPQRLHYGVTWQAAPPPSPVAQPAGTLLLLDGTDTIFRTLAAQRGAAAPLVRVTFAKAYRELGPTEFEVRADDETDFRELFAALQCRDLLPQVILHRCSDGVTLEQSLPDTAALHQPVFALLHVAKALMGLSVAARYIVIADAAAPQHQALAAFLKTLALEQPAFSGKVVSIDGDAGLTLADEVAIAAAEIAGAHAGVEEVRYRCVGAATERCVRRIAPCSPATAALDRLPLKHGGVYLITGGLGGLGLLFGEYLAQHHAARLVLVGRSASSPQHEPRLARLRQHASEIVYMQADVSRAEDAERVVREIKARYGSLSGVIHAAGVTRDGFVLKKTGEDMRAVFDPKIGGAIQLDRATRDEPLDLFILFASIAGVNGNVGQADYAYANQFLDAFAERRGRQSAAGLRAGRTVSVDWPLWRDGGMQISAEHVALLQARTGLALLPTDQGLRLFEELLCSDRAQDIAVYGLASRIDAYVSGLRPPAAAAVAARAAGAAVADTRTGHAGAELPAQTLAYVKTLIGEEIKLAPEHIDPRERLESFGMDSVAIGKVTATLERDLGELPKTLLYEHETIAEVVTFLSRHSVERLRAHFAAQASAGVEAIEPSALRVEPVAAEAVPAQAVPSEAPVTPTAARDPGSLSARVAAQSATQKIAIVGVHGHYPQSRDMDAFWQLLRDGRDATGTVPADRWDAEAYYDADPAAAGRGKIYCRSGGFLSDVDKFDTGLFKIQREEASVMDPQERLFLQSVWSALEDAGYTRDELRARHAKGKSADVGVFVGVTTNSYAQLAEDARRQGNMLTPSAMPWSIANRVSYFFDFKGPSLPVDTACSSSLVAVHMACESLRRGECQVAVAGGVNLYLHPSKYLSLCQRGMLARGGKTHSYGAGDDGFVPGEGVGTFILKPLEQAVADNDRIHGVIAGSAFEHSGRSNGYSAPNPNSQAELIARTLAAAEVEPGAIGCVEGHGTGTPLGDSLEVLALSQAFRRGTDRTGYCSLGSVKANVGHSESAAGVCSMAKALLQLQHGQFVPSLHSGEINPDLNLAASPFYLQHSLADWPREGDAPRRALVNSFGAGGVNACLVLEEYVSSAPQPLAAAGPQVLALSAESDEALRAYAERFAEFLEARPQTDLAALCHTVQVGREALKERLALIAMQPAELAGLLRGWLAGSGAEVVHRGRVEARRSARRVAAPDETNTPALQRAQRCAQRWVAGEDPAWQRLHGDVLPPRIAAPTYPFAAERCWIVEENGAAAVAVEPATVERLHPLVSYNSSTLREVSFDSWISTALLTEFQLALQGARVLPAAAILELACACASLAGDRRIRGVRDVVWAQPLHVPSDVQLVRTYVKHIGDSIEYVVTSLDDGSRRTVHSEGRLLLGARHAVATDAPVSIAALAAQGTHVDAATHYQRLEARGIACGTAFRSVQEIWCGGGGALARLALTQAPESRAERFVLHPALIDGAFQTALALLDGVPARTTYVPLALEELSIVRRVARNCYVHAQVAGAGRGHDDVRVFDIRLLNERGELLVAFKGLALKALQHADSVNPLAQAG